MEKVCSTCKQSKDLADFFRDRTKKDGHQYRCIECHRKYNPYKPDLFKKRYILNREYFNQKIHDWAVKNKEKCSAHSKVQRALIKGELYRKPCEVCGAIKVDAHHDDYSKPLEVRWLCKSHHMKLHFKDSKSVTV